MQISKKCNLLLSNLFYYDFEACYFNILSGIGYDLSGIDFNDKIKRNIQLGILQKGNPSLIRYLMNTTENLIDHYISINNINKEEIIIRQRDGLVLTKKLTTTNDTQKLDLRFIISKMIISVDRNKYLIINQNGKVEVKGIKVKTYNMDFLEGFNNLDFSNKNNLLKGVEQLRLNIFNSDNILWFSNKDSNNIFKIPLIGGNIVTVNSSSLKNIDIREIDKTIVWEEILWPFCRSVLVHCTN
jgi:hypothetical protein